MKVLTVEDDRSMLEFISRILGTMGFITTCHTDPPKADEALGQSDEKYVMEFR